MHYAISIINEQIDTYTYKHYPRSRCPPTQLSQTCLAWLKIECTLPIIRAGQQHGALSAHLLSCN